MNSNESQKGSGTKPLLKALVDRQKADLKIIMQPSVGSTPLKPSDLYQDPGGGYNTNFTFPQK